MHIHVIRSRYLDVGKYFLKRPEFKSASVSKPTPAEREALFAEIDVDGSGELDLSEVHRAVAQLWPNMAATHTERAFATADEDGSGLVGLGEFKKLMETIEQSDLDARGGDAGSGGGGGDGQISCSELIAWYLLPSITT